MSDDQSQPDLFRMLFGDIPDNAGPPYTHTYTPEWPPDPDEGLSESELGLVDLLGTCWTIFSSLPEHHPTDLDEFMHGIHVLQRQVMARAARRDHPDRFTPMVATDPGRAPA